MRRGRAFAAASVLLLTLAAAPGRCAKVLRVCDDVEEPASLNPYLVFSEKAHTLLQQMLEGLVRFGPDGRIEPALAQRWRRLDARTMRFYLRPGVRFHDGELVDAETVKFSLEKYMAPETHYPGIGFVTFAQVVVVDSGTVDVVTREPDGLILNRLSLFGHIVPWRYYQKVGDQGFSRHPVGTGPFQFERWNRGEKIVLSANKDYWMRGYPKVDRLEFYFLARKDQIERLLAGKLDIVTDVPGTETLRIQMSKISRIVKTPSLYTVAGSFNTDSGPTRDERVRKALNYAIDKQELIRYDLLGNGAPVDTLLLKGQEAVEVSTAVESYAYDPNKARALLNAAGAAGLKLSVLEVKATRAAKIIAGQWKRVGVLADVVSTTDAMVKDDIKKRQWDVFIGGCPDPMYHSFFIQSIFLYSKSPYSLVHDPELDRMIEDDVRQTDPAKQVALSQRLAAYVNRRALTIFTYQEIKIQGVARNVTFQPSVSSMPYFWTSEMSNE